jgi:hypothetical protein
MADSTAGAGLSAGGDIAGILSALMQIIGTPENKLGDPSDVTNINQAQTDQMIQQLTQILGQSQAQTDQFAQGAGAGFGQLGQQGQTAFNQGGQAFGQGLGQAQGAANRLGSLQGQLANMPGFDPSGATDIFQQNIPIFQDLANQARSEALSSFERPAATQALFQSDQNVQGAANQFAGLGAATSGAAASAAAQGAIAPLLALDQQRAALGTQAFQSTFNPLLQQGQQLASQENQFGFNAGINQLLQLIGAAQSQGQLGLGTAQAGAGQQALGQQGQIAGAGGLAGLSSLYAGLQGGALSGLAGLSQPEFFAPAIQPATGIQAWLQ